MRGYLHQKPIKYVLSILGQLYYLLEVLHVHRKVYCICQGNLVASNRNEIRRAHAHKNGGGDLPLGNRVSWAVANMRTGH